MVQTAIRSRERKVGTFCIHGYPVVCMGAECDSCELVPQTNEYLRHINSGSEPLAMPGSEEE